MYNNKRLEVNPGVIFSYLSNRDKITPGYSIHSLHCQILLLRVYCQICGNIGKFLLRKMILSTFCEERHALLAFTSCPALEKTLSEGTDVPLTVSLCLANFERCGYKWL